MAKQMPLLSVIIPIYNGERFVDTIFDCFRQQADRNFELIFVDDGSSDGTAAKIRSHEGLEEFPFTVETIAPAGVSGARNRGLSLAQGKYISFMDADDRIVPEYTTVLGKLIDEYKSFDICMFQSRRVPEDGPFKTETTFAEEGAHDVTSLQMLDRIASNPTKFGVYNMFVDRRFIKKHSFKFSEGYDYYEDYDLMYRMCAVAERILLTEHQMYFYLLQEGSAVASFKVERLSCVKLLESDIPFLKKHAPKFVKAYKHWVIPRIYWSVMWQACLAFSGKDACWFAKKAKMRLRLLPLLTYPDKKVSLSTLLFEISPRLFILAAKVLGRSHSRIGDTDKAPFEEYFKG